MERTDFHPGEKFRDTNGELIQAHGGGILVHDGVFYLYGENKDGPTYTAFSLRCRMLLGAFCRVYSHTLVPPQTSRKFSLGGLQWSLLLMFPASSRGLLKYIVAKVACDKGKKYLAM